MSEKVIHAVVAVAILAAYTVLTVTGHDANALLAVLAGQGIGAGVSVVSKTTDGT